MKENKELVFEAFHGGFFGPSHYYYISKCDNDTYEFKYAYSDLGRIITDDDNTMITLKKEQHYKDFIKELSSIISKWKNSYVNYAVLDGIKWEIKSKKNNFEYSGSNKFPDNYEEAIKIINNYFDVKIVERQYFK